MLIFYLWNYGFPLMLGKFLITTEDYNYSVNL